MALTPEDKYHLDKWWILQELKGEFLVSDASEMTIIFNLREDNAPSKIMQAKLLEQLSGQHYFDMDKIDDKSYKITYRFAFEKVYNHTHQWFRNFSEVTGIKSAYELQSAPVHIEPIRVRLSKDGRGLWLATESERIFLNRFTTGRPPELIMGYLIINRPGSLVTLAELKRDIEGVASVDDISEVIRKLGFDKQLKNLFFKRCGKMEVELINSVEITYSEWLEIKQKIATGKIRKKSKKS